MLSQMVCFNAPEKWALDFFDRVESWRSSRPRRTHVYETDAAAYCAHLGLRVDIKYCHVEFASGKRALGCVFKWESSSERELFFKTIGNDDVQGCEGLE